jgi:hypothetical protein
MRTQIRESSLRAHDAIQADGTAVTKAARVLAYVRAHPRCSRQDIAKGTGITINCVCGRVNELIESGELLERELDKTDPVSGKRVNTVAIMPQQRELALEAE